MSPVTSVVSGHPTPVIPSSARSRELFTHLQKNLASNIYGVDKDTAASNYFTFITGQSIPQGLVEKWIYSHILQAAADIRNVDSVDLDHLGDYFGKENAFLLLCRGYQLAFKQGSEAIGLFKTAIEKFLDKEGNAYINKLGTLSYNKTQVTPAFLLQLEALERHAKHMFIIKALAALGTILAVGAAYQWSRSLDVQQIPSNVINQELSSNSPSPTHIETQPDTSYIDSSSPNLFSDNLDPHSPPSEPSMDTNEEILTNIAPPERKSVSSGASNEIPEKREDIVEVENKETEVPVSSEELKKEAASKVAEAVEKVTEALKKVEEISKDLEKPPLAKPLSGQRNESISAQNEDSNSDLFWPIIGLVAAVTFIYFRCRRKKEIENDDEVTSTPIKTPSKIGPSSAAKGESEVSIKTALKDLATNSPLPRDKRTSSLKQFINFKDRDGEGTHQEIASLLTQQFGFPSIMSDEEKQWVDLVRTALEKLKEIRRGKQKESKPASPVIRALVFPTPQATPVKPKSPAASRASDLTPFKPVATSPGLAAPPTPPPLTPPLAPPLTPAKPQSQSKEKPKEEQTMSEKLRRVKLKTLEPKDTNVEAAPYLFHGASQIVSRRGNIVPETPSTPWSP